MSGRLLVLTLSVGFTSGLLDFYYFDNIDVTLHVFSGKPDPVWRFYVTNPTYRPMQNILAHHNSTTLASRLGYKGFTLNYKDRFLDFPPYWDAVYVTLHVFSGQPDPVWQFPMFVPPFKPLKSILAHHNSTTLQSRLGYRGFSLRPVFWDIRTIKNGAIARCADPKTELFLLDHVEKLTPMRQTKPLSKTLIESVRTDIHNCN